MTGKHKTDEPRTGASVSRRRFLADTARTACGVGLLGLGVGLYAQRARSLPPTALRPPGALPENDFLAACTRCGLCVRDCPYDTLRLADLGDAAATGTPFFIAREIPCEMCEDIPCIRNCPTGALDPGLEDIESADMGLAVVVDQESCIAFQGLRCEICFNVCPVRGKAITLEMRHNPRSGKHAMFIPTVHSEGCTGCGLCEKACILDEAAVKVLPRRLAKGELGKHYRLGWKQKDAAGESLVTPDREHRYNLPRGARYEHGGRGLVIDVEQGGPQTGNPVETLNRGMEAKRQ